MHRFIFASLLLVSLVSCTRVLYKEMYPTLLDGKYDPEFPYQASSKQLEEISHTIQRVNTLTSYRAYSFALDEQVTKSNLTPEVLKRREGSSARLSNENAGTATVIGYEHHHLALLTCAHVVDAPDTLFAYYRTEEGKPTPYLRSVSVKISHAIFLTASLQIGSLELLAVDRHFDLAIIGTRLTEDPTFRVSVFAYPLGKSRELEWGTFVYIFGYPAGYKVITKGIVSSPNRDRHGSFLVDAVLTGGSSGGIAVAIRDGIPNFELVGMMTSSSGRSWNAVVPFTDEDAERSGPSEPYTGPLRVERRREIHYGIAQAISSEAILGFIEQHRRQLQQKGYSLTSFLRRRQ
jgi:hypothetical protein